MSDGDALLRAILDDPDDDAPRLVYADWLDEQGDSPRAIFIRTQIELARLPADDPARDGLVQAERTLWRTHRAAWTEWVPSWARVAEFRRGFLEEIRCQAADFLAGVDGISRQTPLVAVRLDGMDQLAIVVFQNRLLHGLRSIRIGNGVPPTAWLILAECPYLGKLHRLDIGSSSNPDRLIATLIASKAMPALRGLRVKGFPLGDEPASLLVGNVWSARLRVLDLGNNFIALAGARKIAESPHLGRIVWLNLMGNPLASNGRAVELLRERFGTKVRV